MDLGLTITGIVMLAICGLPFILPSISRKKREKHLLQSISNMAEKLNCKITQHECCNNFAIGIDETKDALFFCKEMNDTKTETHINLSEIQSCKVVSTSKSTENKDNNIKFIDKIELSFLPITKDNPSILLEFYKAQDNFQSVPDFLLIEKWEKIINEKIKLHKN